MQKLIVQMDPKSPVSEAYRTLRTNIQFASFDNKMQAIMVTSSGPSEGKSTTAANLALTMAEAGSRVLLMDCDLRKPVIHKYFNVSNVIGLSNLLVEEIDFDLIENKYKDNLYILTSGKIPPNPSEMLSSQKMRSFLDTQRELFDYIIIDTPPVIAVTDAQIISTMVDGVLLVVSAKQAEKEAVVRAKALLTSVKANIIGVILNKVEIKPRAGYYKYYGEDEKKESKMKGSKTKRNKTKGSKTK